MRKRLRWYSFRWRTGLVLLVAFAACWYLLIGRFRHPAGSGPAGPAVGAECFSEAWSERKTIVVGLGDSITAGFGAARGRGSFALVVENDDEAYPDMMGRDLIHVFPDLDVLDYSRSYTVSAEHLEQQLPRISTFPDSMQGIVIMTTGGNDIIHDYGRSAPKDGAMYGCSIEDAAAWSGGFRRRLEAIIDGAASRFPGGCEVFLADIYDPTDGGGDIENAHLRLPAWPDALKVLSVFNGVIASVCSARDNVHLVDIHSEFLGHGIHCSDRRGKHYRADDPHYWYFVNLEDPNERGHDAIRRVFLVEMARVLCER